MCEKQGFSDIKIEFWWFPQRTYFRRYLKKKFNGSFQAKHCADMATGRWGETIGVLQFDYFLHDILLSEEVATFMSNLSANGFLRTRFGMHQTIYHQIITLIKVIWQYLYFSILDSVHRCGGLFGWLSLQSAFSEFHFTDQLFNNFVFFLECMPFFNFFTSTFYYSMLFFVYKFLLFSKHSRSNHSFVFIF